VGAAPRAAQQMASSRDVMRTDRLKQVMLELDPAFDEKKIGYSKFSRFVQEGARARGSSVSGRWRTGSTRSRWTAAAPPAEGEAARPAPRESSNGRGRGRGRGRDRERDESRREPSRPQPAPIGQETEAEQPVSASSDTAPCGAGDGACRGCQAAPCAGARPAAAPRRPFRRRRRGASCRVPTVSCSRRCGSWAGWVGRRSETVT
jgi:hypothetical protein